MGLMLGFILFLVVFAIVALLLVMVLGKGEPSPSKEVKAAATARAAAIKKSGEDPLDDFRKSVMLSAVPWINDLLLKFELAPRLRILLYQANLKWTTGGLLLGSVISFALPAYLALWRTGSLIVAVAVGLVCCYAPFGFVLFKRGKRFDKFEEGLPEALDLMVSALRAGHSFNAALGLISRECADPIGSEFRICFDEQNYGLELRSAMDNLLVRVPLPDLGIAVTAILIQKETGGNLAEVLNKSSEVIRERFRLRRQVKVHSAHGRITGMTIAALPIFILLAVTLLNYDLESLLWTTALGRKMLCVTAAMEIVGGLIIRSIINVEV